MVGGVVDSVDTNSVDSQLLELFNVALADGGVCDGVRGITAATGLVVDSADVEAVVAGKEGIALDGDGGQASRARARCCGFSWRGDGVGQCSRGRYEGECALHCIVLLWMVLIVGEANRIRGRMD